MPFAKFGPVHFHRGILKKAVAYFYYCTKDHPFENGNKRSAVVIMLFFLAKNGMWLDVDPVFLYEVSKALAQTEESPAEAIKKLVDAFKPHLETLTNP